MAPPVPPSHEAQVEALRLSAELLRNVELSELPLTNLALKAARLARILNDFDMQKVFELEVSGYAYGKEHVPHDEWRLCELANRIIEQKTGKPPVVKQFAYTQSIAVLEQTMRAAQAALGAAQDGSVSVSSANPSQIVMAPPGNAAERQRLRNEITTAASRLAARQALIYRYALERHYELKFSGIAADAFSRMRQRVDALIGSVIPGTAQKLSAVYDNLRSQNAEDWASAVHSCRRILQDLADAVMPPGPDRVLPSGKTIKMGKDQYINRLIAFVEDNQNSERFVELVGSHLGYLGDRLDAIFRAAQKGSHDTVDQNEAERYTTYTYLIVGDILSIQNPTAATTVHPVVEATEPEADTVIPRADS